ncbi:MAG: hypothetical protein L0211_14865 [Planctomycetaceae bacterium]|nr:hypothetical protein [Planctomycetaceae bacterium]
MSTEVSPSIVNTAAAPPVAPEPVTAEVVRPSPAPSPWRFGLKALLGLMAACSVQFAAMSYLGVLAGFVAGVVVCFAAFTAIIVIGPFLTDERARLVPQLDVMIVRLMLAIVILIFASIISGGGTAAWHVLSRIQTERLIEQKLGLSLKPVMIDHNQRIETGLLVESITGGGAAHQAGLQKNDVVLIGGTVAEYLQTLYENRGKEVNINVATGALSKSVESCPQRTVTLAIPR